MSISFSGDLEVLNLDVADLVGLSQDQIEAKITAALPSDLSATEIEELKTELLDRLEVIGKELSEIYDGYETDAEDSTTTEGQARYEAKMDEVEEALATLEDIEDAADDPLEHLALLYQESTDDISWTTNGLNEGDAVTLKCTGTQADADSMWGEDESEETAAVEAGEDGIVTYADYEAAQVDDATATADAAQMLFLGAAGENYTLVEEGADYTIFNVTDVDGNSYTLRIEGSPAIYFEPGTVTTDGIANYSEALAKRTYERGDTLSFYEHQNTDDLSDADKLTYVETYTDVTSSTTFDSAWAQVAQWIGVESTGVDSAAGTTVISLVASSSVSTMSLTSDAAYDYYKSALDQLYGWFNDSSASESITAVWSDIFSQWATAGLTDNEMTALVETLVLGVFSGSNQIMFQAIMGPAIGSLETYINTDSTSTDPINEFDKMIMLLLETNSGGVGRYGGSEIWTNTTMTKPATDAEGNTTYSEAEWNDHPENSAAIEMYKTTVFGSWTTYSGYEDVQIGIETEAETYETTSDMSATDPEGNLIHGFDVSFSSDLASTFRSQADEYAQKVAGDITQLDGADQGPMRDYLIAFADHFSNWTGDIDELRAAIYDYIITTVAATYQDEMATTILIMIYDLAKDSGLFWDLCRDKGFRDDMWSIVDNGGDAPTYSTYLGDLWNEAYKDNDGNDFTKYEI